jgi:acylphosphatase
VTFCHHATKVYARRDAKSAASIRADFNRLRGAATVTERREIYFSGRVQGVGFRYTARAIAARLPVTGFVENLPDGRVLLIVEGGPETITKLVTAIQAELERYIVDCDTKVQAATGEFSDFYIRR